MKRMTASEKPKVIEISTGTHTCECGEILVMRNLTMKKGVRARGAKSKCGIIYARENTPFVKEFFKV